MYSLFSVLSAAPGNLTLVPSDPTLTLEWDRPVSNSSIPVPLTYIVDINSTDPSVDMNFRNMTSELRLSIHFLEVLLSPAPGQCIMFSFSVSASNIAGVGEAATIIDTVPICEFIHVHTCIHACGSVLGPKTYIQIIIMCIALAYYTRTCMYYVCIMYMYANLYMYAKCTYMYMYM
jgi:hypothetical protein